MITVCIKVGDDGKISVGIEPPDGDDGAQGGAVAAAPGGMPGMPAADDSYMQPAPDIDSALAMAKQMLEQGAQQGQQDGEAAFQSGFAGARGMPPDAG